MFLGAPVKFVLSGVVLRVPLCEPLARNHNVLELGQRHLAQDALDMGDGDTIVGHRRPLTAALFDA